MSVAGFTTREPNMARVYDYILGGKDHFAADREVAEKMMAATPDTRNTIWANRAWLGRAVRFLAGEAGIGQFLDVGSGLPSKENVHEVAQAIDPAARVAYVDIDPIVLVHARALLDINDRTKVIGGDLRHPERIIEDAAGFLDFEKPIGVMLGAVMHFIEDRDRPYDVVRALMEALPSGSYMALSHVEDRPHMTEAASVYQPFGAKIAFRTRERIAQFFDGLELVEPGLVRVHEWRPLVSGPHFPYRSPVWSYAAIGRKP
ncbi:MAG TPA: SAM-dependent methyltransferase [Thermopolyspora sp.]